MVERVRGVPEELKELARTLFLLMDEARIVNGGEVEGTEF